MAKTQVIEWGSFMQGKVVPKVAPNVHQEKPKTWPMIALMGAGIALSALHTIPALAAVGGVKMAMATASASAVDPSFLQQLEVATKPIKDVIFGFGHEIYFVFMAWGALEALIGKAQQGFTRMKVATGAYILLYWVPTIVDLVNSTVPKVG